MSAACLMLYLSFALSVDVSTKVLATITEDFMIFSQFLEEILIYDYFSVSVHYIRQNAAKTAYLHHG